MNSSSSNREEKRGQIAACLVAASLWAGANLIPLTQELENPCAQSARERNSGFGGLFAPDLREQRTLGHNDVTNLVSSMVAKSDLHWELAADAIAKVGSDPSASRPIFDAIVEFIRARSIELVAVSAWTTTDCEEGVDYASIRFLIERPFEEAMDLDSEMTGKLLDRHRFPENVMMSIRSFA